MNRPAILTKPEAHSPSHQNLALFRIYVGYRSLLSIVLLIMLVSPNTRQLVGTLNPTLYTTVALAYLATSIPLVGGVTPPPPPWEDEDLRRELLGILSAEKVTRAESVDAPSDEELFPIFADGGLKPDDLVEGVAERYRQYLERTIGRE